MLRLLAEKERRRRAKRNAYFQYQNAPDKYARDVLGVTLTDDQTNLIYSISNNRRTAVKASHAIGKTFTAAVAANWWYDCWNEHIVYITAPTWTQALNLTFKQLKKFRRENKLAGRILETGRILDDDKLREPAHFIRALNAESGEGFQGEHSAPILIIFEEAVGVANYIWEAADGLMTHPDCRLFAIGNPTDEANQFGEACESANYNVFSISALNHPNITAELNGDAPPFPLAVRLQWLFEMMKKDAQHVAEKTADTFEFWALPLIEGALQGKPITTASKRWHYLPSAHFQGRVLGEFPTQADAKVIPLGWLRSLQPIAEITGEPQIGCDVARYGDDRTTVCTRRGASVLSLKEIRKFDSVEIAKILEETAVELSESCANSHYVMATNIQIKIDVTGGLGTGPADILKHKGYNVIPVNSSNKANDAEQYPNKRSELWFDVRDRVKDARFDLSELPVVIKSRLERELSTPGYSIKNGRKTVEDKAEMKKRLGYSPDLADGVNLAFAPAISAPKWEIY